MPEALFGASLFPYLAFLWLITKSGKMPRLSLFGFYGTLVFVAITIPAGLYAKASYGTTLANVDWLHGSAESFLTMTNILVVMGFKLAGDRLLASNLDASNQDTEPPVPSENQSQLPTKINGDQK